MRRGKCWNEPPGYGASRAESESGSASLEFITAGMLLLIPVIYLVLVVSAIQGAALATEGATRQAARIFVQAPNEAEGFARVQRAIEFGLQDYGLDMADASVTVACSPNPASCLQRRGVVTVSVDLVVNLPMVPAVLGLQDLARVPVAASATQQVSRFWSGR